MERKPKDGPVRYAVVGLGHIAQVAVLPAFAHAKENSAVTALVSDDAEKRNARHDHAGRDRPADEEFRDIHVTSSRLTAHS